MVYLDTNVLIYASVEQSIEKKERSLEILEHLISSKELILSTLVLQEFVFTMAKLKIDSKIIKNDSDYYFGFVGVEYDYSDLKKATDVCCQYSSCKNINDILHLILARKSKCKKLITFDNDFRKMKRYSDVAIEMVD